MSGISAPAWQTPARTIAIDPAQQPGADTSPRGHRGMALAAAVAGAVLAIATTLIPDSTGALLGLGGLVIVFGGVTASAFMTFRPDDVRAALASIVAMVEGAPAGTDFDLRRDIEDIVAWARIAYGPGMRALEHSAARKGARDPFVIYGLNLVVSDYPPEDIRAMLQIAADGSHERALGKVDVLAAMASHAPAFGMVGTLIGMISMLRDMSGATGAIGGMLAVAFLSTLYGVLSARMIYMPAATRLERQVEARRLRDSLVTEGMVMLAARKPATVIRDRLSAFLHHRDADDIDVIEGSAERVPGITSLQPAPGRSGSQRMLTVIKG